MSLSRRQRTDEAILRATLEIILSGKKLTKAAVCSETPCSPATLFRFYPDLEVAQRNCFSGMAARDYAKPFYSGLESTWDKHATLADRLTAIIDLQNAYVHTHLNFIKELMRAALTADISANSPAILSQNFCRRLAQDTLSPTAAAADVNMLEAQLQQLIGFHAMLNGYQVASSAGVSYKDHSTVLAKAILSQLNTSQPRHRLIPPREKHSASGRLQSMR